MFSQTGEGLPSTNTHTMMCLFAILHTRRRSLYPRHTTQCWYYRQGATVQSSLRPFHPRVPSCRTIAGCHEIPYWVCHAVQQQQQYRTGWIVRGRVPWFYSLRSVGVVQSCNCRCISCVLGAVLWRIVCLISSLDIRVFATFFYSIDTLSTDCQGKTVDSLV